MYCTYKQIIFEVFSIPDWDKQIFTFPKRKLSEARSLGQFEMIVNLLYLQF